MKSRVLVVVCRPRLKMRATGNKLVAGELMATKPFIEGRCATICTVPSMATILSLIEACV